MRFSWAPRGLGVSILLESGRPRPVLQNFLATWRPCKGHERPLNRPTIDSGSESIVATHAGLIRSGELQMAVGHFLVKAQF